MQISDIIKKNRFSIIVKPNSNENRIVGTENNSIKVNISAPADKDKANKEVIRFFSRLLKRKVRIKSGLKSRKKVLECF